DGRRPQPGDDGELLLEHLEARADGREGDAVGSVLLVVPPGPEAELHPATAHGVDLGDSDGQGPRQAERHRCDEGAEADPLGVAGQPRQGRPRIGRAGEPGPAAEIDVVVGAEEGVEAQPFGGACDREQLVVARPLLRFGEDAKVHGLCLALFDVAASDSSDTYRIGGMRVSLRAKLIGALVIVLVVTGAVGWAGLRGVQRANHAAQTVYVQQVGPVVELSHTAGDIREQRQLFLLHVITTDPAQLPPLEAEIDRLDARTQERFDDLAKTWATRPVELDSLARLRQSYSVFRRLWTDRTLPLSRNGQKAEAADTVRGAGTSAFLAVDSALNDLVTTSDLSVR